jgi:hypothetical protein
MKGVQIRVGPQHFGRPRCLLKSRSEGRTVMDMTQDRHHQTLKTQTMHSPLDWDRIESCKYLKATAGLEESLR